jgi:hypothetical protein
MSVVKRTQDVDEMNESMMVIGTRGKKSESTMAKERVVSKGTNRDGMNQRDTRW